MTTARDVVTRAMRRLAILEASEAPDGSEGKDGLDALNELLHSFRARGVDVLHADYTLNSTIAFFVPPKPNWTPHVEVGEGRLARALRDASYQGEWDANANSPALTSGTGTRGHVYKVGTAGTTTLDGVSSWAVNDFLIFDEYNWLKCQNVNPFIQGLTAMLAVRIAEDYGRAVKPVTVRDAEDGWQLLLAQFMVPDQPTFDRGLSRMPSQRYVDYFSA